MRLIFFTIIIIKLFFFQSAYSVESYVVLKINNNIITNVDIANEYRYLIALNKDLKNIEKERVLKLAKDSIIREKIKEHEITKYFDLSVKNKFLDEIIKNFYTKLGFNKEKQFVEYLLSYNLSYQEVKRKISIEAAWNDLIYKKFLTKIEINEVKIKNKINEMISSNKKLNVYLLSEILFNVESTENIETKYNKILQSINENGFKNTANIYSVSDTAKLGGQIGWIKENQLSENIKKEIAKIKIGEHTKPIIIPGGFLILNIDNIKLQKENLNFDEEFNKHIAFEKNMQLDKFSKIYFSKIKKNSTINEK